MSELTRLTACAAVDLLRRGKVSPLEMIDAAVLRIEATDSQVNALPTLCIERAREHAQRLMGAGAAAQREVPLLAGLPIAVKDLKDVAGVRTTYGSPIFADHVPERSDILVETLEDNGAIVLAKSNTPEFGHGANTFNEVFGKTRNPWNTAVTCGGYSGGAAVAVATGQVWLATGSDLGCSLRTPAAFCSVVGLRPAPGRVARGPLRLHPALRHQHLRIRKGDDGDHPVDPPDHRDRPVLPFPAEKDHLMGGPAASPGKDRVLPMHAQENIQ